MPVIKSSKKRIRQTAKKTARNTHMKKNIRLTFNQFEKSLATGKTTEIVNLQTKLNSLIDTACKKNLFHKNKAARRKSRIAKMVKKHLDQNSSQKNKESIQK